MNTEAILAIGVLFSLSAIFFVQWLKLKQKTASLLKKNATVESLAKKAADLEKEAELIQANILSLEQKMLQKNQSCDSEIESMERKLLDRKNKSEEIALAQERTLNESINAITYRLSFLQEEENVIEFGLYQSKFNFETSENYKDTLEEIYSKQKELIKKDQAVDYEIAWTVSGSKTEGRKMQKQYAKLLLRAFNGEADAASSRVTSRNIESLRKRLTNSFEAINKLGSVMRISIIEPYLDLRMKELELQYEFQIKISEEREEQKELKAQMKEEEREEAEQKREQEEAEAVERQYQEEVAVLKREIASKEHDLAHEAELNKLREILAQTQSKVDDAQEQARRIAQAEITKTGHIYILSNIGSLGENIFKLGMTRRVNPQERVNELSSASLPFPFDVHAFIKTTNAPKLEGEIHSYFSHRKVNLVNGRKEFFHVTINEIQKLMQKLGLDVVLSKTAEASDYRETLRRKEALDPAKQISGGAGA